MTTAEAPALLIHAFFLVIGLTFFIAVMRPKSRLDTFRQDLFRLRDELFDTMAAQGLDFDDPAYGALRKSINGYIRIAPFLNLFQVGTWRVIHHWIPVDTSARQRATDPRLEEILKRFEDQVDNRALRYLLQETLIGLSVLFILILSAARGQRRVSSASRNTVLFTTTKNEAREFGSDNGPAANLVGYGMPVAC